jgi:hypothetical protein
MAETEHAKHPKKKPVEVLPWYSPDIVRSYIAFIAIVVGVAVILESLFEYSAFGTTPSPLIVTPAVGFVTAILGYYFGNAGVTRAEKQADTAQRGMVNQSQQIDRALPEITEGTHLREVYAKVLAEMERRDPELFDRVVKFADAIPE